MVVADAIERHVQFNKSKDPCARSEAGCNPVDWLLLGEAWIAYTLLLSKVNLILKTHFKVQSHAQTSAAPAAAL